VIDCTPASCDVNSSINPIGRRSLYPLGKLPDGFHVKLAKTGLIEPREPVEPEPIVLLHDFIKEFIADGKTSIGDVAAESTIKKWETTQAYLTKYFANVEIDSITARQAKGFRQWLEEKRTGKEKRPLSENSRRKHIAIAKLFFNAAVRLNLIAKNPFAFETSASIPNRTRDFFVTQDMTTKLLEAAPDDEWRLLIALWRLAGLRKMEVFGSSWADVLWEQGRMRVYATKTAHHEGREIRYVPLRDIRPYLDAVYFDPATVDGPIVTRFTPSNSNLDKPCKEILHRAGLKPWPKLFQNMRASCETEWLDSGMPAHVVANWIGHSVKVQNDSYAQVDEHHFEQFNSRISASLKSGSDSGSDDVGNDENPRESGSDLAQLRLSKNADDQHCCTRNEFSKVAETGLELVPKTQKNKCFSAKATQKATHLV
jgi:integrase